MASCTSRHVTECLVHLVSVGKASVPVTGRLLVQAPASACLQGLERGWLPFAADLFVTYICVCVGVKENEMGQRISPWGSIKCHVSSFLCLCLCLGR